MEKLRGDRLVRRFLAASRAKLREIADRIGVRRMVNLTGSPIR
jgi:ribosomal protein S14